MKKIFSSLKKTFAAMLVVAMLSGTATEARAQCEFPGVTLGTAGGIAGASVALIDAAFLAPTGIFPLAAHVSTQVAQAALNTALQIFEDRLYRRLRDFWNDFFQALQDMTAQLNASNADQTRALGNLFDTGGMTDNQRMVQQVEFAAKKQYAPTDEGCRFDTAGAKLGSATRTGDAMMKGMGTTFAGVGNNAQGSDAERGNGQLIGRRWEKYSKLFCDEDMNAGQAGCDGGATAPLANANVAVGKTLFGLETIPMNDATPSGETINGNPVTVGQGWKMATDELVYNLINYEAPEPLPADALNAAGMKDRRAEQRAYVTQMDAVGVLVYDIVADRTPGEQATDIQQLRQSNGITDASEYPSQREIRQSLIEQLMNPNYYINLHDSSSATKRKEVYLEAFNLQMLYKIVDKTEKIANAFVAETANMLHEAQGDTTYDQRINAPIRP